MENKCENMNYDVFFFFFWGILYRIYSFAYNNQTAVAQLKPDIYIEFIRIYLTKIKSGCLMFKVSFDYQYYLQYGKINSEKRAFIISSKSAEVIIDLVGSSAIWVLRIQIFTLNHDCQVWPLPGNGGWITHPQHKPNIAAT